MDIWEIGTIDMFISKISNKLFRFYFLLLLLTLVCFSFSCSKVSSQSIEESTEENSTEQTEIVENTVESRESCELIRKMYGMDEWLECRTRIPEREFMEGVGRIIDPIEIDGKYHYTFERLGIEMIVDYPFSEHIYVIERELPKESGFEGNIYSYDVEHDSVYWETYFFFRLRDAEVFENASPEDQWWMIPIVKFNEETYLITDRTISFGGTENMQKLMEENLVTPDKLDEFLEHAEFKLLDQ